MGTLEPLAGAAFADELELWQREALDKAVIVLTDETLQSIQMLEPELASYEDLPFTAFLPPWRSWRSYSYQFLQGLALCVFEMGRRLVQPEWDYPRCTGEEIALWVILRQAEVAAEIEGHSLDADDLIDLMFEDGDFLAYYSEIDEDEMRALAAAHDVPLEPENWFEPFRRDRPVHPFFAAR
jgi:hypothetical protein